MLRNDATTKEKWCLVRKKGLAGACWGLREPEKSNLSCLRMDVLPVSEIECRRAVIPVGYAYPFFAQDGTSTGAVEVFVVAAFDGVCGVV